MNKVVVSVVCYNNDNEVISFAEKLVNQNATNQVQLIVTCNSCNDIDELKRKLYVINPLIKVFVPDGNMGYLNGCLAGILSTEIDYLWAVICNTDITIVQENFFSIILKNIDDDVWCVGPDIVLAASGEHQNPFYEKRPTVKKVLTWKIAYSCYPLYRMYVGMAKLKKNVKTNTARDKSRAVYSVHGSFFMIKKDCVNKIVEEQSPIFMYDEELLIAEIVKENNKKCYYNADAMIIHNENQVTGFVSSKKKQNWFRGSVNYIYTRFFR